MRRRKKREYMEKGEVSEMLDILFHAFKIKKAYKALTESGFYQTIKKNSTLL